MGGGIPLTAVDGITRPRIAFNTTKHIFGYVGVVFAFTLVGRFFEIHNARIKLTISCASFGDFPARRGALDFFTKLEAAVTDISLFGEGA